MGKQELEIEVPAKVIKQPATTKKVVRYSCDICGKNVDKNQDNRYGSGMSVCTLCGRDICSTSKKGNGYPFTCWNYDQDYSGDYPDKYCIICIPLYFPARREMNERHWQEEELLDMFIKKISLGEITGPCSCLTCSGYCGCGKEGHHKDNKNVKSGI